MDPELFARLIVSAHAIAPPPRAKVGTFRKAGLTHPLMAEIEEELGVSP
jgi:hypothetical protein